MASRSPVRAAGEPVLVGVDVGSTTVKAVVVRPGSNEVLWARYQRHETRQADKLKELLVAIGDAFPDVPTGGMRIFATGSGAGPLCEPLGARFVQEVNAVTMAVDQLHPDVGSVIELGGQDAKIVIYKESEAGEKRAIASMNDKCASGTGATIDKCLLKVGMSMEELGALPWDPSRLHHVAAKCGVFAETDIVNLLKSGIPSPEIMASLADAIVAQNLSVLTRGNTLRPKVLLLGGPNTFLPFLQQCWRQRIPETWDARGFVYRTDLPIDELIVVPENAQYYGAYGAATYGVTEPADAGVYRGLDPLTRFIAQGRQARLGHTAGPPLIRDQRELDAFRRTYQIPRFTPAVFCRGETVRGVLGIDGGSTSSKAVLIDEQGAVLAKHYQLSQGNPIADTRRLLQDIKRSVADQGATLDIVGAGATGYAADILEECLRTDVNVVETVAHMIAAVKYFGDVDVICDIGGQDIKVLFMTHGEIRNFRLSNQCSAGNGMLLQAMADQFGIPVADYADAAFRAELTPNFGYGCAVFLDADRVNFQKDGFTREELLAGVAMVLPKNVWQYVVQIPRMAALGTRYVLQGGTQYNLAAVKSQVDYIRERVAGAEIHVHPHPGEAGAIGAALEALRTIKRRGQSNFIGLEAAINLAYASRTDESTRCRFCPNHCARTFIDARTPDGRNSRYISGFSCEKGTVESIEDVQVLSGKRRELRKRYPNLVDYESKVLFRSFYAPRPLPESADVIETSDVTKTWFGATKRTPVRRPFLRSSRQAADRRSRLQIGIPRVLNIYSTAPVWRTYFETLGVPADNVVFSDYTSEELWTAGGRYGSIDPCYPSKVCQAHIHNLLFEKPRHALDYVFFPCITHVPSFVVNTMDSASCPIAAGAPKVIRAAFTKEVDFFSRAGVEYVDGAVTLSEPNYFTRQMFEMWGHRLGITEDENVWACREGFAALKALDDDLQRRGLEILQQLEEENRVGVLLLARPYHLDPGLNHDILDEFQTLGYPVLSIRSVPKDPAWLARFFRDDLERGFIQSPLDVSDVWPENYSSNSVQKVWAAKFAARHPNVVVLDLSSFKCGHDAPTYGLIDNIITSGRTPCSMLHDIDANKPGGSIKIRVRTYAHTLARHEEQLQDLAARRSELERRFAEKRRELMPERHNAVADAAPLQVKNCGETEAEVRAFEEAERRRLGLHNGPITHWRDENPDRFTRAQRAHTTILFGGLTLAHDQIVRGAFAGLGYDVQPLDVPDTEALAFGKEFGNRAQCNPTYFTVGNLIKHLVRLRDRQGLDPADIIERHVFLTAGACGPCRFGTYATEYRKALRDAGFDGFRVLLFQQQGGLRQATGEDSGLEFSPRFFLQLLRALIAGDVLNLIGYRIRPYEREPGATDRALEQCRRIVSHAFQQRSSAWLALRRCRGLLKGVAINRLQPKPKVAIIGEFWAMTTEGDGNYRLQRFLESEGAEVDIQPVTAWLLYNIWEHAWDTGRRTGLHADDAGLFGLQGKNPRKKLALLTLADWTLRRAFEFYANAIGLRGYHLADMDEIATISHGYYDNHLRGGEGHMEVGKLIQYVENKQSHMVISVKPFGCMPSSGVSDGVQSLVTARHPDAIFCPIETTGDGAVNAQSRILMDLFKARQRARQEYEMLLQKSGLSQPEAERAATRRGCDRALYHPPHHLAGTAANTLFAIAPSLEELVVSRAQQAPPARQRRAWCRDGVITLVPVTDSSAGTGSARTHPSS